MMMFQTDKDTLVSVVDTVSKAVSKNANMPSLECYFIKVNDGKVTFRATNLEISIETSLTSMVYENGETLIEAKLFTELVKKLPNDTVTLKQDKNSIKIACKKTDLELTTLDTKNFPAVPEILDGKVYEMSQKILKDLLITTIISVSQDESRPILTGVLFEATDKQLNIVSLDGYRMSIKCACLDNPETIKAIIPGKSAAELIKILKNNDEKVTISFSKNHILFDMGITKVVSTQVNGEFIAYANILPPSHTSKVSVMRDELLEAIDRVALITSRERTNLVKIEIKQDKMYITTNAAFGKGLEEVPISLEGEELTIAFNSKYLLDMLKVVSEEINIYFGTNVAPAIIRNKDDEDSYLYLILPVRLVTD